VPIWNIAGAAKAVNRNFHGRYRYGNRLKSYVFIDFLRKIQRMAHSLPVGGDQMTYSPSCTLTPCKEETDVTAERRRYTRFCVDQGEFQVFSRDSGLIGRLRNIGLGGAAYQYTPVSGESVKDKEIDIMASGPVRFHIVGIACRTVYDVAELAADQKFSGGETRLRGVRFIRLSGDQEAKLDLLLENQFTGASDIL